MDKAPFTNIGWLLIIGVAFSWLKFGYSNWFPLLVLLAYLSFSAGDVSLGKFELVKQLPILNILLIIVSFILSVALVFGMIYAAKYVIQDLWQLGSFLRPIAEILAIIIALYPVKFTFGTIVYKLTEKVRST